MLTLQALSTRKSLKEKYQPMNIFALGELISELNKVCIGPDDDPRDLFTQITRLCNRFEPEVQFQITTDMKMAFVIQHAPASYRQILVAEMRWKGDACQLDDLEGCMYDLWLAGRRHAAARETSGNTFQGKCFNCKQSGHKSNECTKPKSHGNGQSTKNGKEKKNKNKKCRSCGKLGHLEAACWEKASNADMRPNGWRSSALNTPAAAINGTTGVEFALTNIDFNIPDEVDRSVPNLEYWNQNQVD